MSLYIWIDILSISVPLLASFHPRIKLYKEWKRIFLAIAITMVPYIIWDIYFTSQGYWGFNKKYLADIFLFNLPMGEWLFFICIPYACIFTHVSIKILSKNMKLHSGSTDIITLLLLCIFLILLIYNYELAYTAVDMIFAIVVLSLAYFLNKSLLRSYYFTFPFMLIPFFIVNGILTGNGIVDQIVWYNDAENLGIRILTIPIEDVAYAFSLILLNLLLFEKLKKINI
jgi:lycopene cyclase domain-containing protein